MIGSPQAKMSSIIRKKEKFRITFTKNEIHQIILKLIKKTYFKKEFLSISIHSTVDSMGRGRQKGLARNARNYSEMHVTGSLITLGLIKPD